MQTIKIRRHCVPVVDGLSFLQRATLEDPAPIRIFSAPTGAGKSYAFLEAVRLKKQKVLFIVPTRRLAQNLASSLLENLTTTLDAETAAKMVSIWTSDERVRQEEAGIKVGTLRVREFRDLGDISKNGGMVIATPESVAAILLRPAHIDGAQTAWIFDIFNFDHIVFDEFHTIEDRGFGLAASICLLASNVESSLKVTFLSATPVDILPVLESAGIRKERISIKAEEVVTGSINETGNARAIHGDMTIEFDDEHNLVDLIVSRLDQLKSCLDQGRQVVVIFDSVAQLLHAKPTLARLLDSIGIGRDKRLAINSADDNGRFGDESQLDFSEGKDKDPMKFDVLVCTSSVEMGVTFRAGMMFMDPGFNALSFLQRVGRPARGDETGKVFVACGNGLERADWLRRARMGLRSSAEINIDEFVRIFSETTRRNFSGNPDDENVVFGTMPARAAKISGLFWIALQRSWNAAYKGRSQTLKSFEPRKQTGVLKYKLSELKKTGLHSAKAWTDAFVAEALTLRSIRPTVDVCDVTGRIRPIPANIYESNSYLISCPSWINENGKLTVEIDVHLNEAISNDRRTLSITSLLLPHRSDPIMVSTKNCVEEWVSYVDRDINFGRLHPMQARALSLARDIVILTGIIPGGRVDQTILQSAGSLIF